MDDGNSDVFRDYSAFHHYENITRHRFDNLPTAPEPVKQVPPSRSDHRVGSLPSNSNHSKVDDSSEEQRQAIERIHHSKDYYEVLCVPKEFTNESLKKSYRKLALLLHPDKNSAPGAEEAFRAVSNAYGVLTDPVKRSRYDMYGGDCRRRSSTASGNSFDYDYSRGFEADSAPEDVFKTFFGGSYPSASVNRHHTHGRRRTHWSYIPRQDSKTSEVSLKRSALQLVPFIVLIGVFAVCATMLLGDHAYQLVRDDVFRFERQTADLRVPYYVKDNFVARHSASVEKIERQVETEYSNTLRSQCQVERSRAAGSNGHRAQQQRSDDRLLTPSCDKLQELFV